MGQTFSQREQPVEHARRWGRSSSLMQMGTPGSTVRTRTHVTTYVISDVSARPSTEVPRRAWTFDRRIDVEALSDHTGTRPEVQAAERGRHVHHAHPDRQQGERKTGRLGAGRNPTSARTNAISATSRTRSPPAETQGAMSCSCTRRPARLGPRRPEADHDEPAAAATRPTISAAPRRLDRPARRRRRGPRGRRGRSHRGGGRVEGRGAGTAGMSRGSQPGDGGGVSVIPGLGGRPGTPSATGQTPDNRPSSPRDGPLFLWTFDGNGSGATVGAMADTLTAAPTETRYLLPPRPTSARLVARAARAVRPHLEPGRLRARRPEPGDQLPVQVGTTRS